MGCLLFDCGDGMDGLGGDLA